MNFWCFPVYVAVGEVDEVTAKLQLSEVSCMHTAFLLNSSDIIEHIPGLRTSGSRGKEFSLYLSSQLMYGSVKIYQKQCEFMLSKYSMNNLVQYFEHPTVECNA